MIKDREYPATHSMLTSWFAVDNEGNVAFIEFEDGGPIPNIVPMYPTEFIITELLVDYSGEIKRSILTDEQAKSLASCLDFKPFDTHSQDDHSFYYDSVWKIDTQKRDQFFDIIKNYKDSIVILSEKEGLYYIGSAHRNEKDQVAKKLSETKCLLSYAMLWLDDYIESWPEHKLKGGFEGLPMFVYAQECSNPAPIMRLHMPINPVKASQLTHQNMAMALHLPFSFRDKKLFYIPLYYPSVWWFHEDARYITLQTDDKKIPLAYTGRLAIPYSYDKEELDYIEGGTFEPTVAVIKGNSSVSDYVSPEYVTERAFELNYYDIKEHLPEIIQYYRPYILFVMKDVLEIMEKDFCIKDKKLILGDEKYPIFTCEDENRLKEEILALASKPYRGSKSPIIIDKKHDRDNIDRHK